MSELLDRFESLLKEMEQALVNNDVDKVARLTEQQRVSARELAERAKADPAIKAELHARVPLIQRQLEMNQRLLEQGIQLADAVIQAIVDRVKNSGESLFTYSV